MNDLKRLSAIDLFTLGYMVVTLPLLLLAPGDARWTYLAVRTVVAAGILFARRSGMGSTAVGSLVLDLYPFFLFGFFYNEVGTLNRVFLSEGFLDQTLIEVEQTLFGGQPALEFREIAPWAPFAEYVHLGYVSYYLFLPTLAFTLLSTGRRTALRQSAGTIGLTFYVGFLLFILIPVAGPYYNFEHLDPGRYGYVFPHIAQWFVDRGSSVGTAFPSSHVSISVAVWIMAMRYHRGLAWILAFFVPAMAAGAVYGGFHYLVDIVAGAVLGVAVGVWGHRLTLYVSKDRGSMPAAVKRTPESTISGA